MFNEETKLKEKINRLIDKIEELKKQLSEKDTYVKLLEEEIKMLQVKEDAASTDVRVDNENESEMFAFIKDFCLIARMIVVNEDYIKYRYETKNSGSFYKIEQTVFDDYICNYAGMDLKTFLNYCINLVLVKSEKNRSCVYNSGELRVYYVSRAFIEAAVKNEQSQGA